MIGEKIRNIRKKKGLTINELAIKIGVTSGYISQIERNLIDPSLSVLRKLTKAIETPMSVLFANEYTSDVVEIPVTKRKKVKFPDIDTTYEFLTPSLLKNGKIPNINVMYVTIDPKTWSSKDVTIHEDDECAFILEGTLEYHVGEMKYVLNKGDSIYIPENTPHFLYNASEEPAILICVLSSVNVKNLK